jgi:hypothetical protein
VEVDAGRLAGVYERAGARLTVSIRDGEPWLRHEVTGGLAALQDEPDENRLVPLDDVTFVWESPVGADWTPVVFYELPDGCPYVHVGARATPRTR